MGYSPSQELIPNPSRDIQFVKVRHRLISSLAVSFLFKMVLDLLYQYRCIASLQCTLKKPWQTIKFTLSRSSFTQMLINLFANCAYRSVKQTFEFQQSKLKRRDISYDWCYQILYTCTMLLFFSRKTKYM